MNDKWEKNQIRDHETLRLFLRRSYVNKGFNFWRLHFRQDIDLIYSITYSLQGIHSFNLLIFFI